MSIKKFVSKAFLFFLPFLIFLALDLFVLPIDYFTFRAWEALVVRKIDIILEGPFYPNMKISKVERGDMAPYSEFTVERNVVWETDRYGYRKRNTSEKRHTIVIIGDSMIAGGGLTQQDLLSEVLEMRLGVSVYPYAPRRVSSFLKDSRFIADPPDLVIFASAEHQIPLLTPLSRRQREIKEAGTCNEFFRKIREAHFLQSLGIVLDRLYKNNMLRYSRAQLRRKVSIEKPLYKYRVGSMLFFMGEAANRDIPNQQVDFHVQTIAGYCSALQARGISFLFLPIPNKENIYYDLLPDKKRPVYLDQLIIELTKKGVATVNLQEAFEKEYHKNSMLLHWTDDTHWNDKGVKIATDLIELKIRNEILLNN